MLEMLTFIFFVEVGWIPEQEVYAPKSQYLVNDVFYIDMDAYVQHSILWVQVGMKFYGWPIGHDYPLSFYPAHIDFRAAIGLTYNIMTIGIRHLCSRPVAFHGQVADPVEGFYNEIFLRLSNEVKK